MDRPYRPAEIRVCALKKGGDSASQSLARRRCSLASLYKSTGTKFQILTPELLQLAHPPPHAHPPDTPRRHPQWRVCLPAPKAPRPTKHTCVLPLPQLCGTLQHAMRVCVVTVQTVAGQDLLLLLQTQSVTPPPRRPQQPPSASRRLFTRKRHPRHLRFYPLRDLVLRRPGTQMGGGVTLCV